MITFLQIGSSKATLTFASKGAAGIDFVPNDKKSKQIITCRPALTRRWPEPWVPNTDDACTLYYMLDAKPSQIRLV